MKTPLFFPAIIALLFIPASILAASSDKIKTLTAADLEKGKNSTSSKDTVEINQLYKLLITFDNVANSQKKQAQYEVTIDNGTAPKNLSGKTLTFNLGILYPNAAAKKPQIKVWFTPNLKKPAIKRCVYTLDISVINSPDQAAEQSFKDIDLLLTKSGLTLNIKDLIVESTDCKNDTYPPISYSISDAYMNQHNPEIDTKVKFKTKEFLKKHASNRAIYDARNNTTYWIDDMGKIRKLYTDLKYLSVPAGTSVTFEIVNVNHEAYRLRIDDTAQNLYQETNAILDQALLNPIAKAANSALTGKKELGRTDIIKATVVAAMARLNQFLYNQSIICDNLHFAYINNKNKARQRFDDLMEQQPIGKPKDVFIEDFLEAELEKKDSTLIKSMVATYNKLKVATYHMERHTTAQSSKDMIEFKYSVLAREHSPYVDKVKDQILPVYIIGQFKVDVSAGLYYAPGLRNERYALRNDTSIITPASGRDTIDIKRLVKDRNHAGEFGFNSYLHFYKKHSANFSWGGHIGAGVGLEDKIRPRYFFGLSFMFGKESGRIALNLSAVMGNKDVLSNQYTPLNQEYRSSNFAPASNSETKVNYVTKFAIAPAIGISYNLPFGLSSKKQTP